MQCILHARPSHRNTHTVQVRDNRNQTEQEKVKIASVHRVNDLTVLEVEISRHPDSSTVLCCTRQDGSVTWQRQTRHAAHFVPHDLTHYAVETSLGYTNGFFGLITEGWDVDGKRNSGRAATGGSGSGENCGRLRF